MDEFIRVDMELGCGFSPISDYSEIYEQMDELMERLSRLRHYNNADEMLIAEMIREPFN